MNQSKKIKIGIIGCGGVAERWYLPGLCGSKNNYEVVGLADIDAHNLQKASQNWQVPKTYSSIQELISSDEIELAVVLTRHADHYAQVKTLLEAGIHVYVEKPMARNATEALELINLARKKEKVLGTAPQVMLSSRNQKLKGLLQQDILGKISLIRATQSNAGPADRAGFTGNPIWFYQDGGALKSLGIYTLTTLIWLFGLPNRLSAFSGIAFKNRTVKEGPFVGTPFEVTAPDNYTVMLDYGDSTFAMFDTSYSVLHPSKFEFEIYGEKGSLFVGGFGGPNSIFWQKRGEEPIPIGPEDDVHLRWNLSWGVEETVKAILTRSNPIVDPQLSLKVLHLIDAIETANLTNTVSTWDITLRPLTEQDWPSLWELLTDPEVSRYLTWSAYTSENEGRLFLKKAIECHKMPNQFLAIIYKNSLIGTLHAIEKEGEIQIGFSVSPLYRTLELDRRALHNLLQGLNTERCYFDLHCENSHSISVVESLGFKKREHISDFRYRWRKA
jgi:predicted dehydrogenase/RimJ/RimL family protein N-acetyltransferase